MNYLNIWRRQGILLAAALLFSCAGFAQRVTLRALSIRSTDGTPVLSMAENGSVTLNGEPGGVLGKDGVLQSPEGELMSKLEKNGRLLDAEGNELIRLLPDGSMDAGEGRLLKWNSKGIISAGEGMALRLLPNDQQLYKTAALLIAFYFGIPEPDESADERNEE